MQKHKVVQPHVWLGARKQLLAEENAVARLRDELGAERPA
jgi:predicted dithiol-disulfide oxidoreductase (DUF899 family)